MKKISLYLLGALFFTCIACSDDDTLPTSNDDASPIENTDPEEEQGLAPSTVSENLIIANATKNEGNLPSPTGTLSFTTDTTTQTAFPSTGFSITIPETAAGAYLQIKGNDGTLAPEYYDIPNPTNTTNKLENKVAAAKGDGTVDITINFTTTLEPGTFCYALSIYDTEGNISTAIEICVTIEVGGGDDIDPNLLIGAWELDRTISEYTDDTDTSIIISGEEICLHDDEILECDNGNQLTVPGCKVNTVTVPYEVLVINADGAYEEHSRFENFTIHPSISIQYCSVIPKPHPISQFVRTGKWSYDNDEFTTFEEFFYSEKYYDLALEVYYDDYDYASHDEGLNVSVREYMDKKPLDILDFDNRGSEGTETKKSVKAVDENTLVLSYVNDRYKEDASQILTYIYKRSTRVIEYQTR